MIKNIVSIGFLIHFTMACHGQVVINDATNSYKKHEATRLVIDKIKNQEIAATAIIINGKLTISDLQREIRDEGNLLVNIYQLPYILESYGLDSNIRSVVTIERDEINSQDSIKIRERYDRLASHGRILFKRGEYDLAISNFSAAINFNKDKGLVNDRLLLACSYANVRKVDSAFFQLYRMAQKGNFYNYPKLDNELMLKSLHGDPRWDDLMRIVRMNAEKFKPQL